MMGLASDQGGLASDLWGLASDPGGGGGGTSLPGVRLGQNMCGGYPGG